MANIYLYSLPTQSSTLYSNNITKFLLSLGNNKFYVDLQDEVTRGKNLSLLYIAFSSLRLLIVVFPTSQILTSLHIGSIILNNGELLWPAPKAAPPPAAAAKPVEKKAVSEIYITSSPTHNLTFLAPRTPYTPHPHLTRVNIHIGSRAHTGTSGRQH